VINRRAFGAALGASLIAGTRPRVASAAGQSLSLQTAWVYDAESIGYFVARDLGYYDAEGITLAILAGGPDVIPESALLAGKAPIALTTPDTTIKAIADQSAPFCIIGAQFQKNPLGVVSLQEHPIRTPKDMVGKTIAVPAVNMTTVHALLKLNGITRNAVRIVPYQFDPTPLIKGEVDATVDFVTDVPFTIGKAGKKAYSFLLYDYGVPLFNNTVTVTRDFLAKNRPLLVKWLRASRRGWQENFKDPAHYPQAFAGSWFKGTGRSIDNEIFTNQANLPLMSSARGLFAMTPEAVARQVDYFQAIGIRASRDMFDVTLLSEI
jgi:ABC-type nitrate/sulfonate/bicarbonate transport system substrate-binding protein